MAAAAPAAVSAAPAPPPVPPQWACAAPRPGRWPRRGDLLCPGLTCRSAGGCGAGVFAAGGCAEGAALHAELPVASQRELPLPPRGEYCAHCGDSCGAPPAQPAPAAAAAAGAAPPGGSVTCPLCEVAFCGHSCAAAAAALWHRQGPLGLCAPDLWGTVESLSAQLSEAYWLALLGGGADAAPDPAAAEPAAGTAGGAAGGDGCGAAPAAGAGMAVDDGAEEAEADGEEEGMDAEGIKTVQAVYTDCLLALKLVATLSACGCPGPTEEHGWLRGLDSEQRRAGAAIVGNFVENAQEHVSGLDPSVVQAAYEVVVTNSWPGQGARHLYAAHSLLNHACVPSAACSLGERGVVTVRALRPLRPGDELTIDYTDGRPPQSLTPRSRDALLRQWGHPCLCSACASAADAPGAPAAGAAAAAGAGAGAVRHADPARAPADAPQR
eukprot:TRINITY_DN9225_c0_g2_i1.p1 TRINITY_DN9225_c0_g2~~TRINITY_DN9225_c0_g2_i1.p1  ORF type:complete len:439 (+),score=117.06 TRINITY_DN9225_c0_g2_i1:82-1398(+)